MTGFPVIGIIAGIFLGLRFNVLALVPATFLATVDIAILCCVAGGYGSRVIAFVVLETVVLLQIGYIVGRVLKVAAPVRLLLRTIVRQHPQRAGD